METCSFCSTDLGEEEGLSCNTCEKKFHFKCGTGLTNVTPQKRQRTRSLSTVLSDCEFKCPLCRIGEKNHLINSVIVINQLFNENKHAAEFNPAAIVQEETDAVEPVVHDDAVEPVVHDDTVEPVMEEAAKSPVPKVLPSGSGAANNRAEPTEPEPPLPPCIVKAKVSPLHEADKGRVKKLSYVLNTLLRLPGHPNTVLLGDSHFTHMDGKEIDPDDDQVRVRSAGGLCIPSAVHALASHKPIHRKVKTVVWNLGTNDATHSHQHCSEDRHKYLSLLYSESVCVFPKAVINFILPPGGLRGVSKSFIDELEEDLKLTCPKIILFRPPSMRNKTSKGGIHLNDKGRAVFIRFLRSSFVKRKQRVFSRNSGRQAEFGQNP